MAAAERPPRLPFGQKPCGHVGVSSARRGRARGGTTAALSFATWLVVAILAAGAGVAPLSVPPAPAGPGFSASRGLMTEHGTAIRYCGVGRRCCAACATLARLRGGEGVDPPGEPGGVVDDGGGKPPGGDEAGLDRGQAREGDATAAPISTPITPVFPRSVGTWTPSPSPRTLRRSTLDHAP